MRRLAFAGALALAQLFASPAAAQVETVASAQIPAGNALAPNTPSGFVNFGSGIWFGDEAQGLRHCAWIPPSSTDPLSIQQCQLDTDQTWSVGGGTDCIPFCSVGQVAKRSDFQYVVASYQRVTGKPFIVGGGGVYSVPFTSITVLGNTASPVGDWQPLAPGKVPGARPTAVAVGPDGNAYVGFLDTGSYGRITGIDLDQTQQTFQTVGTSINGKSIFGMAFYGPGVNFTGPDLYMVTGDGFYVVPNVVACSGNANNCGTPRLVFSCGGSCNAIAADGKGNLYVMQASGGVVYRYTPATGAAPIVIARGFKVVAAHTNGLGIDSEGNLWIGDNPGLPEGAPNGGRLSRIPAAALPN